ncbi:unnamed protein product, partial [Choristocarpus tenellus]
PRTPRCLCQPRWAGRVIRSSRLRMPFRQSPPRCLDWKDTPSSCSRTGKSHTPREVSWSQSRMQERTTLSWRPSQPACLTSTLTTWDYFVPSSNQLKEDVWVTKTKELVEATMEAFNVYPWETLENV